ncbi:hypothetical protein [Phytopseudomonas flavescens]|nr:hypothetical protein [Pseudomonas flavescens]
MKTIAAALATTVLVSGCMTLSGIYELSLQDKDGKPPGHNTRVVAQGSGIYSMRNAMCSAHPGATVIIKDAESDAELKSQSPYQC